MNEKMILGLLATAMIFGLAGCKTVPFGPDQCAALVSVAEELVVEILHEELSDEDKAAKAARYTKITADIAQLGCVFVPPTGAPEPQIGESGSS